MPSSASARLRFEIQAAGENLNTWGDTKLNEALKRIEEGIADWQSFTITGDKTLTSSNYVADEARSAMISLEGSPASAFTITIPAVEKWYMVRNASGQTATIKTSGGAGVTVATGVITVVLCDGTDCYKLQIDGATGDFSVGGALSVTGNATVGGDASVTGNISGAQGNFTGSGSFGGNVAMGSNRITGLANAVDNQDAATRADVISAGLSSALPGQSGNAGKFVTTDGSNASWEYPLPAQSSSTDGAVLVGSATDGSEAWRQPVPTQADITADTTLTARYEPYRVDSSGGVITLTLPASPAEGDALWVEAGQSAATNKITFARNGSTIMGLSEDMECETDNITIKFQYKGGDWKVTLASH